MYSIKTLLATAEPLPAWASYLIFAGALLLTSLGALVGFVLFRKKKKRRKYRTHRHAQEIHTNPTLAESGGLPPSRPPDEPSGPNPAP